MLTRRVALIDTTGTIPFEQVSKVAAALNLQVQRDLFPIWNVRATVASVASVDQLPVGVWPVLVVNNLPPQEGGVHLTKHKQPYAMVEVGDGWTMAASHECLEMLVDPSGNHLHASTAIAVRNGQIVDGAGKFEYLIEVCDPSEAPAFAYAIDDVTVSDFYTPHFFDPVLASGVRYSFTGAIKKPREVLQGGYLSWFNPSSKSMQQLVYSGSPRIIDLGQPNDRLSLREFVDNNSRPTLELSKPKDATKLGATLERGKTLAAQSKLLADMYAIPR